MNDEIDKSVIEDIPTDVFNRILERLLEEGWEKTFVYDGIDVWIDYGMVELTRDGCKLLLEWTNWFEGVAYGPRNLLRELAERFDLKVSDVKSNAPTNECDCACLERGPAAGTFDERFMGVDKTNGRFGEVSVRICQACGRKWLHYHVEYEAFSRSGRWFTGIVPSDSEASLTPESAASILEELPWHIYGGSFFETNGKRRSGGVSLEL